MPKIKFTRDTLHHEGGPHKAGDVIECSAASAERWTIRNAAKTCTETKSVETPHEDKAIHEAPQDKAVASPAKKRGRKPKE